MKDFYLYKFILKVGENSYEVRKVIHFYRASKK